tara:strand:+ start:2599 stop:2961 length:363 start_codon:yes stop_codon:yes gene_type:complete
MGALTIRLRRLVVVMVGFRIDLPAFTAFHDHTVGIVMGHIYHQLGLTSTATIRFVTTALAHRRSSRVLKHIGTRRSIRGNKNHVELGHRVGLVYKWGELIFQTAHGGQKCQSLSLKGCAA